MPTPHPTTIPCPPHATATEPGAWGEASGLRLVLVYWGLLLSLLAAVTLIAAAFAFGQAWCVLAGVVALRLYAWTGQAHSNLLQRMLAEDDR